MIRISLGNLGSGRMAIDIRGDQRLRLELSYEEFSKLLFGQEIEIRNRGGENDDED